MRPRKYLYQIIKVLFLFVTLIVLYYMIDPALLIAILSKTNILGFVCITLSWSLIVLIFSFRWQRIAGAIGIEIDFLNAWKLFNIGNLYNMVLPGAVGGDAVKAAIVAKSIKHGSSGVLSVIYDRIIGLVGIIIFGVFSTIIYSLILGKIYVYIIPVYVVLLLGIILGSYIITSPSIISSVKKYLPLKILRKIPVSDLEHLKDSIHFYRHNPNPLLMGLVLTLFGQWGTYTLIYLLGVVVGVTQSWEIYLASLVFLPLIFLATILPITPAGIGISELTFVTLFGTAGVPRELALAIPILYRMSLTIFSLHSLFYIIFGKERRLIREVK